MARNILESILSALVHTFKKPHIEKQNFWSLDAEHFSESVSALCHGAEASLCGSAEFWSLLAREIIATHKDLVSVKNRIELEFCSMDGNRNQYLELYLLCGLCRGCVHLGIALSQLLLPTVVDPVTMAKTQYKCHQLMVSEWFQ